MRKYLLSISFLLFFAMVYSMFFSSSVLAQTVTLDPPDFSKARTETVKTCGGYINTSSFINRGTEILANPLRQAVSPLSASGASLKCLTFAENDKNHSLSSDGFGWVASTGQSGNLFKAISNSATANASRVTICTDSAITNDDMEACLTQTNSPDCPALTYYACIFDPAEVKLGAITLSTDTKGKEGQYGTESCDPQDQSCINCVGKGGIWIAIGCVDPTPVGIMTRLVQTGIGVMGGVALLQLIYAGLMYQTGNIKKIEKARSQVNATLVGLAVLVFSILILEVIGVNILDVTSAGFF